MGQSGRYTTQTTASLEVPYTGGLNCTWVAAEYFKFTHEIFTGLTCSGSPLSVVSSTATIQITRILMGYNVNFVRADNGQNIGNFSIFPPLPECTEQHVVNFNWPLMGGNQPLASANLTFRPCG